ncbi:Rz1-like lysis system protein LysC [Halopseudomonas salina]|uniref:Rz1-like lysis system protein LysC n=1 Tax=Halopseudomonas salina TaxID=1323744 RepID=UPI001CC25639
MIKPSWIIWLSLFLLTSACSTPAPTPQTQPPTVQRSQCNLVPCLLPGRPPLVVNEDWRRALDEVEGALESCALQVRGCIGKE